MSEQVGQIYYSVTLDTAEMIQGQRRVQGELDRTTGSLDKFSGKLTQVAGAIGIYASALYLIEKSDAFTKMSAQLKLATDSARELVIAQGDVRRIAQESQADISSVASLYAKVSSSTKEMGISQARVADITRSVSLALKVSGASANECRSAILQLGQAFASGVLRGDEFNSIAETSPRLMKALADGIGVPVGQLRAMAEQGKLTSEVLAGALPKALKDLEQEAKQIQTISGAFQELKNEVMLFIGEQATASGAVRIVAGSISALSNNLGLLAGILETVAAVKFAVWLESIVTQTYATVAANRAMVASNVATASAQVTATAATVALTAARVAELRASVLAAEGDVALAIATNGLIPAQARAAVAADAHAVALGTLSAAQRAASVTGAAVTGVMGLLGGPIGAIVTVLGLGATAWSIWGAAAKKESQNAAAEIEASGREIIASLEKQNVKLRERIALAKAGNLDAAKSDNKNTEALASTLTKINAIKAKGLGITISDKLQLIEYEATYRDITEALNKNKQLTGEISSLGQQSKASEWLVKYATDAERANAEVKKAKAELGDAFTPELENRIRAKVAPPKTIKTSPDEKFDDLGYLATLKKGTVDAWDAITATEQEAARKSAKLLAEGKISKKTHEEALTLISSAAAKDRGELIAKEYQEGIKGMSEMTKARESAAKEAIELEKKKADEIFAITKAANPIEALRQEYEAKLAIVTEYEALMAQKGVDATAQSQITRTQITAEYELQRTALAEQSFRSQSSTNAFLVDSINALSQSATSSIVGLINGTMNATDVMRNLANVVLNEAVSSLVQIGMQQVKNAMFAQTSAAAETAAAAARGGVYAASVAAQVAGMSAMAAQNAFAATAAIPIVGPGLAPAAAATAATMASAIGAPAVATASIAGARQYGGAVSGGSLYRINEKGAPEMYTAGNGTQYMLPSAGGRVTAADKIGADGQPVASQSTSVQVVFNVVQDKDRAGTAQQRQDSNGSSLIDVFVAQIEGKIAAGINQGSGPVNAAMQQTFALNRAPGAY